MKALRVANNLRHSFVQVPRTAQRSVFHASHASIKMAPTQALVHFDSQTCPYAQRTWIALLEKGLPFELKKVDLANKGEEFENVYHAINPDPASIARVPVLIDDDGTMLTESLIVVEYLGMKYRSEGYDYLPEDPAEFAKAKLFIEYFSSYFTSLLLAYYKTSTRAEADAAREKFANGLNFVDKALRVHGTEEGGSFFLGGKFSIADFACVGFLQRAIATLPEYRGDDLWEMIHAQKLDRMERWIKAVMERPSCKETKPADETIRKFWTKFLVEIKD